VYAFEEHVDQPDDQQEFQRDRQYSRAMSHRTATRRTQDSPAKGTQHIQIRDHHRTSKQASQGCGDRFEPRQYRGEHCEQD
jgi:hypothetical protein